MPQSDKNKSVLPKYIQIAELLVRDIAAGRLIEGERLPPERALAKSLGTTVTTLRKSLKELTKKGMLESIQGSGNYIRPGGKDDSVYAMFRLELLSGGGLPRARFLDIQQMPKPDDLPHFGLSKQGTRMRRLRYLNDTIIAIEEIWLDGSAGKIIQSEVSDSLYHYYQQRLGFWINRAEDRVTIARVPQWTPKDFTLPAGTLTGFIERYSWSDQPHAIEYSRTWFDTNYAHYVQRMK